MLVLVMNGQDDGEVWIKKKLRSMYPKAQIQHWQIKWVEKNGSNALSFQVRD